MSSRANRAAGILVVVAAVVIVLPLYGAAALPYLGLALLIVAGWWFLRR